MRFASTSYGIALVAAICICNPPSTYADELTAKKVVAGVIAHYAGARRFSAECQFSNGWVGSGPDASSMTVFIDRAGMLRTDRPVAGGSIRTFSIVPTGSLRHQTRDDVIELVPPDPATTMGIGDVRIRHKHQREIMWLPFVFFDDRVRLAKLAASLDTSGTYGAKSDLVVRIKVQRPARWTLHLVVDPADFHVKRVAVTEPIKGALRRFATMTYVFSKETFDDTFAADTFDLKAASHNVSYDTSDDYRGK